MNEIKVGEYVRTKEGVIAKVCAITEFKEFIEGASVYSYCYDTDKGIKAGRDILKHSPNIIDLIEPGDYVNGIYVRTVHLEGEKPYIKFNGLVNIKVYAEGVNNIVTHEQFNSIKYEGYRWKKI